MADIARWKKHDLGARELGLSPTSAPLQFTQEQITNGDDSFYIKTASNPNGAYNGIYLVLNPMAVHATQTSWDDIDAHLLNGSIIKLTGADPIANIPANAKKGSCKPWVAHTSYQTSDLVYLTGTNPYVVYYTSLINNNIQGVFNPNWEIGTGTRNLKGLFTIPIATQEQVKNDLPTKLRGAPVFTTDTHVLYIFDGHEWVIQEGFRIAVYDATKENEYAVGQIVSGEITGRADDTGNIITSFGIWRRDKDDTKVYLKHDVKQLKTDRTEIHVMPGEFFYLSGLTGAFSIRNGFYQAKQLIALVVDGTVAPSDVFAELDRDIQAGIVVRPTTVPFQPDHTYTKGTLIYKTTDAGVPIYPTLYEAAFNFHSDPVFSEDQNVEIWTLLANLVDTKDWDTARRPAYTQVDADKDDFPAEGQSNTFYIDASTGRIYIWDGTKYTHYSEEYPYVVDITTGTELTYTEAYSEDERVDYSMKTVSEDTRLSIDYVESGEPIENPHFRGIVSDTQEMEQINIPKIGDFCYRTDSSTQWIYKQTGWENTYVNNLPTTIYNKHDLVFDFNMDNVLSVDDRFLKTDDGIERELWAIGKNNERLGPFTGIRLRDTEGIHVHPFDASADGDTVNNVGFDLKLFDFILRSSDTSKGKDINLTIHQLSDTQLSVYSLETSVDYGSIPIDSPESITYTVVSDTTEYPPSLLAGNLVIPIALVNAAGHTSMTGWLTLAKVNGSDTEWNVTIDIKYPGDKVFGAYIVAIKHGIPYTGEGAYLDPNEVLFKDRLPPIPPEYTPAPPPFLTQSLTVHEQTESDVIRLSERIAFPFQEAEPRYKDIPFTLQTDHQIQLVYNYNSHVAEIKLADLTYVPIGA